MELSEAGALLDPRPLPLETGVKRLASDQLLVAARSEMPGCTGEMFEWWFHFAPDTQKYLWWHPIDHMSSDWVDPAGGTHIGSMHVVTERFGGDGPPQDLLVRFVDPAELFGADAVAAARERGNVSGIVYGHAGPAELGTDEQGRARGVRLLHVARDTTCGLVLRTRFWMGVDAPELVPEEVGLALMQHSNTEWHYLARFLPSLYIAENRERVPVVTPW